MYYIIHFFYNYIYFIVNNDFRSKGFADSLFSTIKSPNAQHYSTIIQGMAKYNQVKNIGDNFLIYTYMILFNFYYLSLNILRLINNMCIIFSVFLLIFSLIKLTNYTKKHVKRNLYYLPMPIIQLLEQQFMSKKEPIISGSIYK